MTFVTQFGPTTEQNKHMSLILRYFDLYTSYGMRVIPLYEKSKIPIGNSWNEKWDKKKARKMFEQQNYNMGILLGNFVDVEGDTNEANKLLDDLIGNIPHPMWRSSRSIHHLFVNPDTSLTSTRFFDIEFRGRGVQSVLPPSVHEDGTEYFWLKGSILSPPKMPKSLYDFYKANRRLSPTKTKQPKPIIKPGFKRTICKNCGKPETIHKKRLVLEVQAFAKFGLNWMCHGCREIDVRQICRELRKKSPD